MFSLALNAYQISNLQTCCDGNGGWIYFYTGFSKPLIPSANTKSAFYITCFNFKEGWICMPCFMKPVFTE